MKQALIIAINLLDVLSVQKYLLDAILIIRYCTLHVIVVCDFFLNRVQQRVVALARVET